MNPFLFQSRKERVAIFIHSGGNEMQFLGGTPLVLFEEKSQNFEQGR